MYEKNIQFEGGRIHAEAFGNPSDPAILLVMGATASGSWWPRAFCEQMASYGRFVVRYDHRDTGASSKCPPGEIDYSVEDLADDMCRVLDAYAVAQAHIVGMSLGGFLSQLFALKYPSRVLSLTLVASEPLAAIDETFPPISQKIIDHHMTAGDVDWSNREEVVRFNVEAWRLTAGTAHAFDEAHIRRLAEEDFDRNDQPLAGLNHAQLAGGEEWYNRLDDIRVPVLVIHGTADPVLNFGNAKILTEKLPDSRLLALEDAGHELHPADWPRMLAAIIDHTRPDTEDR